MKQIRRTFALLLALLLCAAIAVQPASAAESAVTEARIDEAITLTLNYYKTKEVLSTDWEAFSINAVGEDALTYGTAGKDYLTLLAENIAKNGVGGAMTDYERTTLGILSAGGDPTSFAGVDLIAGIYNWPSLSQGINAAVFGLIALDASGAVVPNNAKQTRESLIAYILANKSGDGWRYGGGTTPDVDMTGMALYALAPYGDRQDVRLAAEKAIAWLSERQSDDGSYGDVNGYGGSESIAQAICGVTAWGIDPQGARFTKSGGNLVSALLSFQITDPSTGWLGVFSHIKPNPDPGFATQQGLYALAAVKDYMKNGQSRIFYRIAYKRGGEVSFADIYPNSLELRKGTSFVLGVRNQYGSPIAAADFDWTSSDADVVRVLADGTLTATGRGTATIVAKLKSDPGLSDLLEVTVVEQDFVMEAQEASATGENTLGIAFKVTNTGGDAQPAVCIIGLYDKQSHALLEMNYLSKSFAPGQSHVFRAEFGAPAGGSYEVKAMLWNDWYRGRVLCEASIR
jgi:hypothetical protein